MSYSYADGLILNSWDMRCFFLSFTGIYCNWYKYWITFYIAIIDQTEWIVLFFLVLLMNQHNWQLLLLSGSDHTRVE
jgi:hypothetical protein